MDAAIEHMPALDSRYALSEEQIEGYRRDGHVLVRGLASRGESEVYHAAIAGAVERFNQEIRPLGERDAYSKAFLQIMNLWVRDEAVRRYTMARRFGQVAAALMGVKGVRIYHDQALFKEPGGGLTPWHQDQYYWPLDTSHTVTMWMPLVDATPEMGTLIFASGSQVEGYLGPLPISEKSEAIFKQFVNERGYQLTPAPVMAAGDASFHSGWTLHSAPGNQTGVMRAVMTVIYVADETRVLEPDNRHRKDDLKNWLPGLAAGDWVSSPLNPLVYHE